MCIVEKIRYFPGFPESFPEKRQSPLCGQQVIYLYTAQSNFSTQLCAGREG